MRLLLTVAVSALTAFVVASAGAGAVSLPPLPLDQHGREVGGNTQRLADLDSRLSNAEAVTSWLQRCKTRSAKLDGKFVLVITPSKDCR